MTIPFEKALSVLEEIAPTNLAEDWDNVGLLLEPSRRRRVSRVFLTIDLTQAVLEEALAFRPQLIVAYHPPIFAPLRRLRSSKSGERVVLRCAESRVAVYSPHTALDAVGGGVNDWLADGIGAGSRVPIDPRSDNEDEEEADAAIGMGRLVTLERSVSLSTIVRRVKSHLGLRRVRVSKAPSHARGETVGTVALCAGAGGSVLDGVDADVLWTGEMRHHDVLAARAKGTSVVLCEHTNTERGYLRRFRARLRRSFGSGVAVRISRSDRDPLEIV